MKTPLRAFTLLASAVSMLALASCETGPQPRRVPVNAYTEEIVQRKIVRGQTLQPGDPRYDKYVRHTVADDLGNFEFHHLPAGEYFVGGIVEWDASQSFRVHQSSWAWERVSVQSGESVRVVVNQ
jgi:hypothetical protein